MRILAIRGKNLASLPSFEIDLTEEPLKSTRIFAIVGPTGSGKSTLLDALCLALYDRVPRLRGSRDVPAGDLEVTATDPRSAMRKGTGEASAQVDFIGGDRNKYRASWAVWRARKRTTGKIQSQKMQLVALESGRDISGSTKSETLARIEALVGLSFDEFRRAVLLAQGEFAAFLQAKPAERAELLEKMTGTEIYAELSRAAFERAKAEAASFEALEAKQRAIPLLHTTEREALERKRAELDRSIESIHKRVTEARQRFELHRDVLRLVDEIASAEVERAEAERAWSALEPLRDELSQVEGALALRAEHEAAVTRAAAHAEAIVRLREAEAGLAAARAEKDAALSSVTSAGARLAEAQARAKRVAPEIELARKLELQIEEARRLHAEAGAEAGAARTTLIRADEELEALERALERSKRALAEVRAWLVQNAQAAIVAAQWPRWKAELERVVVLGSEATSIAERISARESELGLAEREEEGLRAELEAAGAKAAARASEARTLKAKLEAARSAHPPRSVQEALERLARELASIEAMKILAKESRRLVKVRLDERRLAASGEKTSQEKQADVEATKARLSALDSELARVRREIERVERETELIRRRPELLKDGEPCPLCGSLEHPYRGQDAPPPGPERKLRLRLERISADREIAAAEAASALESVAGHVDSAARARAREAEIEPELARRDAEWRRRSDRLALIWLDSRILSEQGIGRLALELPETPSDRGATMAVDRVKASLDAHAGALKSRLAESEILSHRVDAAREAQDLAEAARKDLLPRFEDARRRSGAFKEAFAAAEREAEIVARRTREATAILAQPFGSRDGWAEALEADPRAFLARAERETEAFDTHQARSVDLASSIEASAGRVDLARAERARRSEEDLRARTGRDLRRQRLDALLLERAPLLGGRSITDASEATERALEEAASTLDRARARAAGASEVAASAEAQLSNERRIEAEGAEQRRTAEARLSEALRGSRIPDRATLERLLGRAEGWIESAKGSLVATKDALARAEATLADRRQRLSARRDAAASTGLAVHPGDLDARDVRGELEAAEALLGAEERSHKDATEALARVESQLAADDDARRRIADLEPELIRQRRRSDRWAELSLLIGSADGRKFRAFAQSLTLDALLEQANLHLEQLRPRYRLGRVPGFDMELEVVDGDMGGEIRAVSTLSGGETFLASLALALALSSVSARDVTIRSLFIDEGFGSLDRDALEMALAVLDQLQAGGRTIGIISHMPDVAERIGYQIQLRPTGPGRSEVVIVR